MIQDKNGFFWVADGKELKTYKEKPEELQLETIEEFIKKFTGKPLKRGKGSINRRISWDFDTIDNFVNSIDYPIKKIQNDWSVVFVINNKTFVRYTIGYDPYSSEDEITVFNTFSNYVEAAITFSEDI